jgi:hypothetical protein
MQAHHLLLMVVLPCIVVTSSRAVPHEKPRQTKGIQQPPLAREDPKPAAPDKERQELEKRLADELLADGEKADRLYKEKVKADPNDVHAWQLLAWNSAYNLAVATRDQKERYAYVRRGIEQLVEGVVHNPKNAALYWEVGWYLHSRVGLGIDRKPFRAQFRADKELHKLLAGHVDWKTIAGPDGLPDNYLVAQRWFEKAIAVVEKHGRPPELPESRFTPALLNAYPAICQCAHARAIENDGSFGEVAVKAWKRAQKMWDAVGELEFAGQDGKKSRLKDNETLRKQVNYDDWKRVCEVEQTEPVLTARQAVYRVERHLSKLPPTPTDETRAETKQLFDRAFRAWADVFKKHPWLVESETDLQDLVRKYRRLVLEGKPLPDDFPLRQVPGLSPRAP